LRGPPPPAPLDDEADEALVEPTTVLELVTAPDPVDTLLDVMPLDVMPDAVVAGPTALAPVPPAPPASA